MVPRHDVTASAPAASARRRSRIIRRRRQYFERLLAAAAVTLVLGFIPHLHWIWFVHLAVDAALGFYVSRLLGYKRVDTQNRAQPVADEQPVEDPIQHASSL